MQIFIYGNDTRLVECRRLLLLAKEQDMLPPTLGDIHLLPIPSRALHPEDVFSNIAKGRVCEHAQQGESEARAPSVTQSEQGATQSEQGATQSVTQNTAQRTAENDTARATQNATPSKGQRKVQGETQGVGNTSDDPPRAYDLAVGYEVPKFFYDFPALRVFDLAEYEPFLVRNARLTALGMVGKILCEHTTVPSEMHIGIIGYGRIGRVLVDILSFLGARVVVFTSNERVRTELEAIKVSTVLMSWQQENTENVNESLYKSGVVRGLDMIINTAPSPLSECFFEGFQGVVYDLASGDVIPKSVKSTRLPSLPARMYAQSAGRAVYEATMDVLGYMFGAMREGSTDAIYQ